MPKYTIPDYMKAAILEAPFTMKLKVIPTPKPRIDEILLKVVACGICGSDVRYFMGENPWSLHTLGVEEPVPPNTILGHEVSGLVVDGGSSEFEDMIGSRVGVIAFKSCGKCYYCLKGLHNLCSDMLHIGHDGRWKNVEYTPGGYAEYMALWYDKAHPIPDNVSFEEATQLDGLAVAVHAVYRARINPGDTVAVLGVGPIGLMILQVARVMGASKIIALDVRSKPLEIAENLGADSVIDVSRVDIDDNLLKETNGIGVDAIFDTVCSESTVTRCLRMMEAGRLAPSAGNRQPWSFIIVKDKDVKRKLVDACRGQSFVADASFIVVVLGDPNASRWYKQDPFIAASFMTLEAYEEGLGVCWVGAFDEDKVKEILGIPKELSVVILLTVGVPDESPPQRPRKPLEELFYMDKYGVRYIPKQ